ncbi:MAG TPA: hypothetical protein VF789_24745 [Thermoanaerobaculia bacterium]
MALKTGLAGFLLALSLTATAAAETVVASNGEYSSMAVTGQGDLIVVWQDANTNPRRVYARLYGANGGARGRAFLVREGVETGYQQAVAAGPGGSFVIVWTASDGDQTGIFAQRFDRRGKRVGDPIQVNRAAAGYQNSPVVDMDRDGSFVVAWLDAPLYPEVFRAQRFSATGGREGAEIGMEIGTGYYEGPFVTVDPEGFSVAWNERAPAEDHHDRKDIVPVVARFTPDGQPAAPVFRLFDGIEDGNGWRLRTLDSSAAGAVALFDGNRNSIQLFSPAGDPDGTRTVVGKRAPCLSDRGWCEDVVATAMDSSGRFAVVWLVTRYDVPGSANFRHELWAQLFDAAGRPLGGRVQINRDYDGLGVIGGRAAALSDDGVLTFVWAGRRFKNPPISDLVFRQLPLE